jgi:hypothetical protein
VVPVDVAADWRLWLTWKIQGATSGSRCVPIACWRVLGMHGHVLDAWRKLSVPYRRVEALMRAILAADNRSNGVEALIVVSVAPIGAWKPPI